MTDNLGTNLCQCPVMAVRPETADHQWRKVPTGQMLIDPVADEPLGRAPLHAWREAFRHAQALTSSMTAPGTKQTFVAVRIYVRFRG